MGEQTLPLNHVGAGKRSRKAWVVLALAVIAVAALLISGIWSRVKARTALNTETVQAASDVGVGCVAETNSARQRNHPAWKRANFHHLTHLRPHQRLSEEVGISILGRTLSRGNSWLSSKRPKSISNFSKLAATC